MSMANEQFLLVKLAEEASELAQVALKAAQFGLEDGKHDDPYTNQQRLEMEFNDLLAIIHMLEIDEFIYINQDTLMQEKKELKVRKWRKYSIHEKGKVQWK